MPAGNLRYAQRMSRVWRALAVVRPRAALSVAADCYTRVVPESDGANSAQDICPLCGGPNGCGIAAGADTCWCFTAAIPPAALERVPDEARDRTCICAACASQAPGQTGTAPPSRGKT